MKREWVQSLVRELRSPMPHGVAKKEKGLGGGCMEIMQHLFKKKAQPVIPDQNTGAESRCSFGISRPWCPWEEPCDEEAGGWAPGEKASGCRFLP